MLGEITHTDELTHTSDMLDEITHTDNTSRTQTQK